jgi:hypothetical protein
MERKFSGEVRVGLVADPDFPDVVATRLATELPERLREEHGEDTDWSVEAIRDPVTAGRRTTAEILAAAADRRERHGWDYAVCLTDLPLREGHRPVLAEASTRRRAAVVCLPALGGLQPFRRAREFVLRMVRELSVHGGHDHELVAAEAPRPAPRYGPKRLFTPIQRRVPDQEGIDVRYSAPALRGRLRLISGMMRSNRPWRLVFGLSSALAAAVATGAYGLVSSTVWQLGDTMGPWRLALYTLGSMALMTGWLVVDHNLWENRRRTATADREQVLLYNVSTVLTLATGIACLYLTLFVIIAVAASFVIEPALLARTVGHQVTAVDYLGLAWAATSMGIVAGALGSGLESEEAVHQATYGYREKQRRSLREGDRAHQDQQQTPGEDVRGHNEAA